MTAELCRPITIGLALLCIASRLNAIEYHVAKNGNDKNTGNIYNPFLTISHGASIAKAGDTVTVHAGVYWEWVQPMNSGNSPNQMITYRAAPNEKVIVKGSELVKNWVRQNNGAWRLALPNKFFDVCNPYNEIIQGDWFFPRRRILHTGEVYLNEKPLYEAASLSDVLAGRRVSTLFNANKSTALSAVYSWFCMVTDDSTIIYANFQNHDPNEEQVEINVRPACFYPTKTGVNFIRVQRFEMSQAATQWAAPTAEQIGLIGTNWSKGWVIENNTFHDSKCVGITLGKDRASGHNVWLQNPSIDGSLLYNQMVQRVIAEGWNKSTIGSHIVRNNTVYNCGEAGICGSFGAAYSTIVNNHIFDVYTNRPFWGAEMCGIKLHGAIDVAIKGNRIHNTNIGIWLDWMAQGTRVSSNLVYDNDYVDFFPEVDHGPFLVDNNIFISAFSLKDWSEGGAYVHNLFAGLISCAAQERVTPYFKPHSTSFVATKNILGGDNRFYNNIFIGNRGKPYKVPTGTYFAPDAIDMSNGYGLACYRDAATPVIAASNIYLNQSSPLSNEKNFIKLDAFNPQIRLSDNGTAFSFQMPEQKPGCSIIKSERLGKAMVPDQAFENPDGSGIIFDKDFFGTKREAGNVVPGPFAQYQPVNNIPIIIHH